MFSIDDFSVNSDYDTPWIVYKLEWSQVAEKWGYGFYEVQHGLAFTPLIFGSWSVDNFNTAYDLADFMPNYSGAGQPELAFYSQADATNIGVSITNNRSADVTFSMRLMAFAPPDYVDGVMPVGYSGNFAYNSNYNYLKLCMSGRASGSAVVHGLGYVPQARAWSISGDVVMPGQTFAISSSEIMNTGTGDWYYHVYGDRADG